MSDAMEAIFGSHSPQSDPQDNSQKNNPFEQQRFQEQQERFNDEKMQAVRHKELEMTEVYNLRKAKDDELVKELLKELRALGKEVKTLNASTQTSIFSDIVNPGTGHVHFLHQMIRFVISMRKQMHEANDWIASFQSRKGKKSAFWGKVYSKHGGTAYMMSQEHAIARSVG